MAAPAIAAGAAKAGAWLGRAALQALAAIAKRKTAGYALRHARLIAALLLTTVGLNLALVVLLVLGFMQLGPSVLAMPPGGGIDVPPGSLICPVKNPVVTQGFGPTDLQLEPPAFGYPHFHAGIDLAVTAGTVIWATEAGTVEQAASQTDVNGVLVGYGRYVKVASEGGLEELYGHMLGWAVQSGDHVTAGQVVGSVDSTGSSTGSHLHYEMRSHGVPIDPAPYIRC